MKQARVLNSSELKRVLTVAAAGKHGQRNCIALLLSHYAGLRVGEIASLRWQQLLETDGSIKAAFYLEAENTKSGEARAIHLNSLLIKELSAFNTQSLNIAIPACQSFDHKRGRHFPLTVCVSCFHEFMLKLVSMAHPHTVAAGGS